MYRLFTMDGIGRQTIKNIKIWTKVNGWTDGRKSVRRGLIQVSVFGIDFRLSGPTLIKL